jgi:hypothetical protein
MQPTRRHRPERPAGQITRGKTASNRLRRVDSWLILYDPALIRAQDGALGNAPFVDLGFGAEPTTTLESGQRLRRLNPALRIIGVEIDRERVLAAQPYADALTEFRFGGFNLPLEPSESARIIRAFNVLRQYEQDMVAEAYRTLCHYLIAGGLLIEGTSDPFGRLWVANLLRKRNETTWVREGIVFSTNFRTGFRPEDFQPVLPKNLIHRVTPGEPIHTFFESWKQAYRAALPVKPWGPRQLFIASAQGLRERGYAVDLRRKWLARGYLLWRVSEQA